MRKALTMIELIISMVIIGIVFTVIPRLVIAMNQNAQTTIKEEALYNALSLMGSIVPLSWDNNNTVNSQILNVTNTNGYDCNTSTASTGTLGYRVGGFSGGRNCQPLADGGYLFNATAALGREDSEYNDMDDFNGYKVTTHSTCSPNLYDLNTTVAYSGDDGAAYSNGTTNTKVIRVKVGYNAAHKFYKPGCITDVSYTAYNIGNIQINKREW